jgi:hypothetical protein
MDQTWTELFIKDLRSEYPRAEIDRLLAERPLGLKKQLLVWLDELAKNGVRAPREAVDAASYLCLLLAGWRTPEALSGLLALEKLSDTQTDQIFGEFYTETYPWLLAQCADGGEALLLEKILDPKARRFTIDAAAIAMTARVIQGRYSRSEWKEQLRAAIELHAKNEYFEAVSELIWLAATSDLGFEREWIKGFFDRKQVDSSSADWSDMLELVFERRDSEKKHREHEIQMAVNEDVHHQTQWWSIRKSESDDSRVSEARRTASSEEGIESFHRSLFEERWRRYRRLPTESEVPNEASELYLGFEKQKTSLNDREFLSYCLGAFLSPAPNSQSLPLKLLERDHQASSRRGVGADAKAKVSLAPVIADYWRWLEGHFQLEMKALMDPRLAEASGPGTVHRLGLQVGFLRYFVAGLHDGGLSPDRVREPWLMKGMAWLTRTMDEADSLVQAALPSRRPKHYDAPPTANQKKVYRQALALIERWIGEWSDQSAILARSLREFQKSRGMSYDGGNVLPFVRPEPKAGRNDPCPCGSGRKAKKCCQA